MHRSLSFVLAGGLSLALAGLVVAKPERFADLAPRDTAVIIDIPNFTNAKAALDRSGLMALWNDRALRNWFDSATSDVLEDFKKQLSTINLSMDDIKAPAGVAGFALWVQAPEGRPTEGNFHILAAADFGDNANTMAETISTLIERGERENNFTVAYDKFGDIEIVVLTLPEPENEWGMDDSPFTNKLHYARHGTFLTLSSSMNALEDTLEAIGGKNIDSAADSPDLAATLAQHPNAVQAYAALLNAPLFAHAQRLAAADELDIPLDIFKALGLTEVRAASVGLNLEPRTGLMEQTVGVLMNEKRGLFSLMDVPPQRFQPPAFVSADAASISMFQFNISGLLPLVRQIVTGSDDPGMQMAAQQLPMVEQMAGPILNSLGSRIYLAQSYARPFSANSERMLVAIDLRDRDAFTGALGGIAPMLGLQTRDFQGNQIWSMPMGGDFAIAAAGGFVYIGTGQAVEDGLRQADRAGGLGQEGRFTNAMNALSNAGLSFGWTDMAQVMRYTEWAWKNQEAIVRQRVTSMFGDDPEFEDWINEMVQESLRDLPEWQKNPPSIDAILRHIGDSVFEFTTTSDGIRGRFLWLKPN